MIYNNKYYFLLGKPFNAFNFFFSFSFFSFIGSMKPTFGFLSKYPLYVSSLLINSFLNCSNNTVDSFNSFSFFSISSFSLLISSRSSSREGLRAQYPCKSSISFVNIAFFSSNICKVDKNSFFSFSTSSR